MEERRKLQSKIVETKQELKNTQQRVFLPKHESNKLKSNIE